VEPNLKIKTAGAFMYPYINSFKQQVQQIDNADAQAQYSVVPCNISLSFHLPPSLILETKLSL